MGFRNNLRRQGKDDAVFKDPRQIMTFAESSSGAAKGSVLQRANIARMGSGRNLTERCGRNYESVDAKLCDWTISTLTRRNLS